MCFPLFSFFFVVLLVLFFSHNSIFQFTEKKEGDFKRNIPDFFKELSFFSFYIFPPFQGVY